MEAGHQRPVIPVQEFYGAELNSALANVFAGKIQPREALKYVSERVDAELAKALSSANGGAKPK